MPKEWKRGCCERENNSRKSEYALLPFWATAFGLLLLLCQMWPVRCLLLLLFQAFCGSATSDNLQQQNNKNKNNKTGRILWAFVKWSLFCHAVGFTARRAGTKRTKGPFSPLFSAQVKIAVAALEKIVRPLLLI